MNIRLISFESLIVFIVVLYLMAGCSYVPECDKTVNKNIPASCSGMYYRGNK